MKKYPTEFIQAVKKVYPKDRELHHHLTNGEHEQVGRILLKGSTQDVPPRRIVQLIAAGLISELKAEAEQLVRQEDIYLEWLHLPQH